MQIILGKFHHVFQLHYLNCKTLVTLSFESNKFALDWKEALVWPLLKKVILRLCSRTFAQLATYLASLNYKKRQQLSNSLIIWQLMACICSSNSHIHNITAQSQRCLRWNMTFLNVKVPKVTLIVLLDLSVAFDPVRHETLLSHLRSRFWVDGKALDSFASFLADRSQCVVMNGGVLSTFSWSKEFHKGAVLALFFSLYTQVIFLR